MDRKIEKKTWTWQRLTLIGAGLALASVLIATIYKDAGTSRLNVEKERLLLDTVQRGVFKEYITLFGVVEPIKTVYLDAIEGGRVEEVFVENGSMVKKGQQILRLSNLELQLNVLNQEAQIVNQINDIRQTSILMDQQSLSLKDQALDVQFRMDLIEKRNRRNQDLYTDKVISQVEFEDTRDEFEHLKRRQLLLSNTIEKDSLFQVMQENQMASTLDLMQRNLNFARNSLENLIIKAPIDGQISSLDTEVGQLIIRGNRIAQIDVLEQFKIRANIDEFYINRIFPQQEGTFLMEGQTYTLRINKIYPEVTNGSFAVDLIFVGERPERIKRGQTISLKLSLSDDTQAMLLAKGGYYQSTGGNWVYVLDPAAGVARKRNITVGRQNPNYYELIEGLQPGEVVIVSSYENYGDKEELILK
ncbi:efflux RND transporter periplasmic adaptor subunit [Lewinella cohaerens]|uniref:efflux RND transporter periplasmic adaptor subunit n=1 Tax=Lewinella cohaerens TaxID=70995 RepID=UPI00036497A2|nr:efflux RND transporter periplasmic adaptor subunit [Lewinella cohaerens]